MKLKEKVKFSGKMTRGTKASSPGTCVTVMVCTWTPALSAPTVVAGIAELNMEKELYIILKTLRTHMKGNGSTYVSNKR